MRPVEAVGVQCETRLVVGSIPTRENDIFNKIFRSAAEAKRGVGIRHLTRNASRKWITECLNVSLDLPILLYAGYSVKLKSNTVIYSY